MGSGWSGKGGRGGLGGNKGSNWVNQPEGKEIAAAPGTSSDTHRLRPDHSLVMGRD